MTTFTPRQKLWLEAEGRLVMSDYRVRLLALIAESGSLAVAATELGLSYRRAWGKIKELEQNVGFPLVQSAVGGAGGGHTSVTQQGIAFIAAYQRFHERMEREMQAAFEEELSALMTPGGGENRQ